MFQEYIWTLLLVFFSGQFQLIEYRKNCQTSNMFAAIKPGLSQHTAIDTNLFLIFLLYFKTSYKYKKYIPIHCSRMQGNQNSTGIQICTVINFLS